MLFRRWALGTALAIWLLTGCVEYHNATHTCKPIASATPAPSISGTSVSAAARDGVFFARWWDMKKQPKEVLEAFSLTDGQPLGTVSGVPSSGHRASDGTLWYTLAQQPCYPGGGLSGPAADTCGGSVVRFDPISGRSSTIFQAPSSQTLEDAVPSPDGKRFVYRSGRCDTAFMNEHLVVRDLATGAESTIGAMATPCHFISTASWSRDGSNLAFTFAPSVLRSDTTFVPHATCESPGPGVVAVVPASGSEIGEAGTASPETGCSYTYAVFNRAGIVAVEACGEHQLGPAWLVQLNSHLEPAARFELAPGSDPTTLAVDASGSRVLVNEYESPVYGGPPGTNHDPVDWIQLYDGRSLRLVLRNPGKDSSISSATF